MTVASLIEAAGGRKFVIAAFFALTDALGLFTDQLTGTEFLSLAGLVLGLYGLANVGQKGLLARGVTTVTAGSVDITLPNVRPLAEVSR